MGGAAAAQQLSKLRLDKLRQAPLSKRSLDKSGFAANVDTHNPQVAAKPLFGGVGARLRLAQSKRSLDGGLPPKMFKPLTCPWTPNDTLRPSEVQSFGSYFRKFIKFLMVFWLSQKLGHF